jgi:hypothetical protein
MRRRRRFIGLLTADARRKFPSVWEATQARADGLRRGVDEFTKDVREVAQAVPLARERLQRVRRALYRPAALACVGDVRCRVPLAYVKG